MTLYNGVQARKQTSSSNKTTKTTTKTTIMTSEAKKYV